jgi:hypothetical protein
LFGYSYLLASCFYNIINRSSFENIVGDLNWQ